MDDKIDFVVLWVDGNDPEWQKERNKYSPGQGTDSSVNRYRDWGTLKYWFRGIERYAPWVNKVYFVTNGQKPEWLNTECDKLVFVKHSDFIDEKYLPLFNSSAIECTINRIKGLSSKFVLFNDDMFLVSKTRPTDFFRNNLPVDEFEEAPIISSEADMIFPHILINDLNVVCDSFDKRKFIKEHFSKYVNIKYGINIVRTLLSLPYKHFVGVYNPHLPQAFLKEDYNMLQREKNEFFENTLRNRFRSETDITQYAIRYYRLFTGNFCPRSYRFGKYFNLATDKDVLNAARAIIKNNYKTVCLNDTNPDLDFKKSKMIIVNSFEKKFGNKSLYEK